MPELDLGKAVASDLTNQVKDFSVASTSTDGPTDQKKTRYIDLDFNRNLGYYTEIPELRSVINAKASWTIGKGYIADEITTMLLDTIKGNGKDTFNSIMENNIRTYHIGKGSFNEIIRDEKENLINLKPLDPSVMEVIINGKGIITGYDQMSKVFPRKVEHHFEPEEIFHLPRNRTADGTLGESMVSVLINIILMKNEAMHDWKRVLHRNVDPLWIFHLDTDDTTKIAAFKVKHDAARGKGENMYVPKDVVVPELVATAGNASLNPLPWIEMLDNKFYEAAGVPKIIVGGAGGITEAAVKIAYLAFQQTIEEEQLYIEEQILSQLNLVINLEFPASLENELLSDKAKDVESGAAKPSDTTAGVGE